MRYTLIIAGKLNNMNDYTDACRVNPYKGAKMKHQNEESVLQERLLRKNGKRL